MRRFSVLRYLLVWPLVQSIRARTRRSLAWRLALSHLLTVLFTLVALCVLVWGVALTVTVATNPAGREPATDARAVAQVLTGNVDRPALDLAAQQPAIEALLGALARRDVTLDKIPTFWISFDSPRQLEHVRSISLVAATGTIVASSDTQLVGRPAHGVSETAAAVVARALAGSTDRHHLSILRHDGGSAAVGAFPLVDASGEPFAVLVDKSSLANKQGWSLLWSSILIFAAAAGSNLLIVILPATAVAAAIGIPRARSIVRPVRDLSDAALTLAGGRLDRRVTAHGDDEVAALAGSFNLMADHLQTTIAQEAAERARVEERTRELTALLEISRTVTSTLERQPLVALILDQLRCVVDYTGAALMTLEQDTLTIVEDRTLGLAESERGIRIAVNRSSPIWVRIAAFRPVLIADVRADEPLADSYRAAVGDRLETPQFRAVRSWLAVPLSVKERVVGMLSVSRPEPGFFTEQHVRLLQAVADQAALAIENARLYQQAASLAALEERNRLARDLHDSVTQSVFSVAMMARAAQIQHQQGLPEIGETLERIRMITVDALAEMRALIQQMRPAALEDEGLRGALRGLVDSVQARTNAQIIYAAETAARLPIETESAVFRIVQEALANAVKHAGATEIAVRLSENRGVLRVVVSDNGRGFDAFTTATSGRPGAGGSIGLRSMRERALASGIMLRIDSTPGAGTSVMIETPAGGTPSESPSGSSLAAVR